MILVGDVDDCLGELKYVLQVEDCCELKVGRSDEEGEEYLC